jgi:membrane protein
VASLRHVNGIIPAMVLGSIAKKLFRTLARVIPQCGMVSQAVAFNMFLAFFPSLLGALGLMSSSLRGKSGQELVARLSAILPRAASSSCPIFWCAEK